MHPRLTTHASAAALSTTTSSAVRPDGNDSSTVRTNSGTDFGRALLEEGLTAGAVHESLERHRSIADAE